MKKAISASSVMVIVAGVLIGTALSWYFYYPTTPRIKSLEELQDKQPAKNMSVQTSLKTYNDVAEMASSTVLTSFTVLDDQLITAYSTVSSCHNNITK